MAIVPLVPRPTSLQHKQQLPHFVFCELAYGEDVVGAIGAEGKVSFQIKKNCLSDFSIHDVVVVLLREELLGVELDGHTTFAFILTGVELVGEAKRGFTLLCGHAIELFHFTRGYSSLLEDQVTTFGGFS